MKAYKERLQKFQEKKQSNEYLVSSRHHPLMEPLICKCCQVSTTDGYYEINRLTLERVFYCWKCLREAYNKNGDKQTL